MKQSILWTCLVAVSCTSQQSPTYQSENQSEEQPATTRLAEASALLESGRVEDIDAALQITDNLLDQDDENREALLLAAEGSILLAQSGRRGFFYEEAGRYLEEALEIDGDDAETMLRLSWVKKNLGEFGSGANLAAEAASVLKRDDASREEVQGALLLVVDHQIQLLADTRRNVDPEEFDRLSDESRQLASQALGTIQRIEDLGPNAQARIRASRVHQWVARYNDATTDLTAGLREIPDSWELHTALEELYLSLNQPLELASAYDSLVNGEAGSTTTLFYAGRAQAIKGNHLGKNGDLDPATRAFRQARSYFEDYLRRDPGQARGTWWVASTNLSLARLALEGGRYGEAENLYVKALEADPRVLPVDENSAPDVLEAFAGVAPRTYLGGFTRLGQAIASSTDPDAQRKALELFERFLARHDQFGFAFNNAAFAAREWGSALAARADRAETDGNPEHARTLRAEANKAWERSYELYEATLELWPSDARTANDAGLMLVYHLNRDYDRARTLFDRAIDLGKARLDALPEDAPTSDRHDIEEAIGDAYQNIGKMLVENLGRAQEAQEVLTKSLEFFPYNGRSDAIRLLSRTREALQDPQDREREQQRRAKLKTVLEQADQAAAADGTEAALAILDSVGREMSGLAPFHYKRGSYQARFARETSNGFAFQDARNDLERAVMLDRNAIEPRLEFATVLFELGEFGVSAEQSRELLSQVRKQGITDEDTLTKIHEIRAKGAARAYIAARQANETGEPLLTEARDSFRAIEGRALADATLRPLWSNLEAWAGAQAAAFQVIAKAYEQGHAEIGDLVEAGKTNNQSAAVVESLQGAEDPTTRWWRGRARFDLCYQIWSSGDAQEAAQTADSAIADFLISKRDEPGYTDTCDQWIALCLGRRGYIELAQQRRDDAQETFLEALETRADQAKTVLGTNQSIYIGLLTVADAPMQAGDFDIAHEIFARASALLPDDVDLANNSAFSAREHANGLVGRGEREKAIPYYQKSYRAYTLASTIAPDDLRVRNDRALILVYYLGSDLDLAQELLDSTVSEGQERLDAMNENTPDAERNNLSEIVGDAWENLGTLHLAHREDLDEAESCFRKSLTYYSPSNRAASRQRLRQIEQLRRQGGDDGGNRE
ncbi:MAG: hypothetical protein AAF196_04150 [Planctomycetota bacterium]